MYNNTNYVYTITTSLSLSLSLSLSIYIYIYIYMYVKIEDGGAPRAQPSADLRFSHVRLITIIVIDSNSNTIDDNNINNTTNHNEK